MSNRVELNSGKRPLRSTLEDSSRAWLSGTFGISTGWFAEHQSDFPAAVAYAATISLRHVEVSALSATKDLPALDAFLSSVEGQAALARFDHVSLHGPAKHLDAGWETLIDVLDALSMGPATGIVLHPDTFDDVSIARRLGAKAVFENMDVRKNDCRTAPELRRIFDTCPAAGFCLDVAHVWTIDPTLAEGHKMLDAYGDRLREVHVSGIEPDGTHRPTTFADLAMYAPLLDRCGDAPLVFEAPLP